LGKRLAHTIGGDTHAQNKRNYVTHAASFQWLCQVMDVYRYRLQAPKT
jgi:hypothetical protein